MKYRFPSAGVGQKLMILAPFGRQHGCFVTRRYCRSPFFSEAREGPACWKEGRTLRGMNAFTSVQALWMSLFLDPHWIPDGRT